MEGSQLVPLFSAIEAHLCTGRAEARLCNARAYWAAHPTVTREQIALLTSLICTPASIEEIAARIGQAPCATGALVESMTAIGLLEELCGGFRATPAAAMYCRTVAGTMPPEAAT